MHRLSTVIVVLLLTLSAKAALVAGPDRPVSTPVVGTAHGYHQASSVASDGTDFLTLWTDNTEGRDGIYATVVSESGATRPAVPTALARGFANADAVWTGDAYLVVLAEYHSGMVTMRMNRDAQVISERVSILPAEWQLLDLAWNGRRALAIIISPNGTRQAILLDATGHVVRSGIAIPSTIQPYRAVAAAAGDAFVVAWNEELEPQDAGIPPLSAVRAVRVSSDGDVGTPVNLLEPVRGYAGVDVASGRDIAGGVVQTTSGGVNQLRRFTIDGATFAVDADPVVELDSYSGGAKVIATPAGFAATYYQIRANVSDVQLATIPFHSASRTSVPVGIFGVSGLNVTSNGRTVLAIWDGYPLRAAAFDADITQRKTDIAFVARSVVRQSTPSIASAGNVALHAWVESTVPLQGVLKVRRFDGAGNALDAQPLTLGSATESIPAAIAFTGKVWIVVWQPVNKIDARVVMQRISPEGVLLDQQPMDLAAGNVPVIASNGSSVVIVLHGDRRRTISVLRLSAEGERLDGTPVVITDTRADHAAIATNGQEYLLTWTELDRDILGVRLASNGTRLDAAPIVIAKGSRSSDQSHVVSHGTDFLVAYVAYVWPGIVDPPLEYPRPTVYNVHTKRVLRNGALADTTADQDGPRLGEGTDPALTVAGDQFVATFVRHEKRGENSGGSADTLTILAVPVDARGAATGAEQPLLTAPAYSAVYGLATVGNSVWLGYARLAPDLGNVQRVYTRELKNAAGAPRRRSSRN